MEKQQPLMRWCPMAECSNALSVKTIEPKPVGCYCGHIFCFQCGENWHEPVTCNYLKQWLAEDDPAVADSDDENDKAKTKVLQENIENKSWLASHTRKCPNCNINIEKNGGCNHIQCRKCNHHFCYVCLGVWGNHSCNRYTEETAAANLVAEVNAARNDLQAALAESRARKQRRLILASRFIHYYVRYMNHRDSLKYEQNLSQEIKQKMKNIGEEINITFIEPKFHKATKILCECRQTLMYTYVFAYYLTKSNEAFIFEDNQEFLEFATEELSEYLNKELTAENMNSIQQKVMDKSIFCERLRSKLLKHVQEGFDNKTWTYTKEDEIRIKRKALLIMAQQPLPEFQPCSSNC